jgi:hypothetical protein
MVIATQDRFPIKNQLSEIMIITFSSKTNLMTMSKILKTNYTI